MIYRHIAYVNSLRIELRSRKVWEQKDDLFQRFVTEETPFHQQNHLVEIKQFLHDDEAEMLYNKTDRFIV